MRSWRSALADRQSPPRLEPRLAFLVAQPFAHRGLHGGDVPENSVAAVRAAAAAGHGIEIDVQLSRDGVPYVIHDSHLARTTGVIGAVAHTRSALLDTLCLADGTEPLPRLSVILAAVDGRVPLLIEAKTARIGVAPLCLAIRRAIEGYRGSVAVMSFNPQVSAWFARHAPRVARGLVVTEEGEARVRARLRGEVRRALALWRAEPDFLAYDVADLPSHVAARARRRGMPVLGWTVRSADEEACAMIHADQIIYERP